MVFVLNMYFYYIHTYIIFQYVIENLQLIQKKLKIIKAFFYLHKHQLLDIRRITIR
jgi:hypothetical protein